MREIFFFSEEKGEGEKRSVSWERERGRVLTREDGGDLDVEAGGIPFLRRGEFDDVPLVGALSAETAGRGCCRAVLADAVERTGERRVRRRNFGRGFRVCV